MTTFDSHAKGAGGGGVRKQKITRSAPRDFHLNLRYSGLHVILGKYTFLIGKEKTEIDSDAHSHLL